MSVEPEPEPEPENPLSPIRTAPTNPASQRLFRMHPDPKHPNRLQQFYDHNQVIPELKKALNWMCNADFCPSEDSEMLTYQQAHQYEKEADPLPPPPAKKVPKKRKFTPLGNVFAAFS